jgi:uncharacterized membrane protein YdjX (TVP38/TMEM64 family)
MSSELIVHWLESWGQLNLAAAGALAAVFVIAAFVPVPRTLLVLGAGAAFGTNGLLVVVPSTTLGCILAFLLARGALRSWVVRQLSKRPRWRLIAQAVDDEGWRIVALMRFWGPLPNCAQNYLFGLTNIALLPYAVITLIFTLPQIVLYTYLGASGRSLLLERGPVTMNWLTVALAATVVTAIVVLVSRRVRTLLLRDRELPAGARIVVAADRVPPLTR